MLVVSPKSESVEAMQHGPREEGSTGQGWLSVRLIAHRLEEDASVCWLSKVFKGCLPLFTHHVPTCTCIVLYLLD
jgi:hypothetical protein